MLGTFGKGSLEVFGRAVEVRTEFRLARCPERTETHLAQELPGVLDDTGTASPAHAGTANRRPGGVVLNGTKKVGVHVGTDSELVLEHVDAVVIQVGALLP